jgi:hypothetical protein
VGFQVVFLVMFQLVIPAKAEVLSTAKLVNPGTFVFREAPKSAEVAGSPLSRE